MNRSAPSEDLRNWFQRNRRDLPWRKKRIPYQIWISEMMLQQTRVEVVVPYFQKWIERFPNIATLVEADLDQVIKQWEGLGYYSRARNIHKAAHYLMEKYQGKFPSNEDALRLIPGIGPYTSAAIASFAFGKRAFAIDGNVKRVLARYYGIESEITSSQGEKELREKIDHILPHKNAPEVMEGLIELGALVCSKTPKCSHCPLRKNCIALRKGMTTLLPKVRKKEAIERIERHVVVLQSNQSYLLTKNKGGLMKGLYQFPFFDEEEGLEQWLKKEMRFVKKLDKEKQTFTRYRVNLFPSLWTVGEKIDLSPYQWVERERLSSLSFCSGHRRILRRLLEK